jgi:hypothetical protein
METEPLDLQQAPRRDDVTVARLRIVPVGNRSGSNRAARGGGTLQINCTVQPAHNDAHAEREAPQVVYARPVWSAPVTPASEANAQEQQPAVLRERARFTDVPTAVMPAPRPSLANLQDLQLRAVQALSGVQAGLNALQGQGIDLRKWSKSSIAWAAAVGVYAVVLFLIAILTS